MLLAGAAIGLGAMAHQNGGTQSIYENELVPTQYVDVVRTDSLKYFLTLNEAASLVGKADQVKQKLAEADRYMAEMTDYKKRLEALSLSPALAAAVKEYHSTDKDYDQARDDVLDAIKQADASASDLVEMEMRPLLMQRQDALSKIVDVQRTEANQIFQDQVKTYQRVRMITVIALLAGLLFALLRSVVLVRSISHALSYAMHVANEIASGKLGHDIQVKGADELAQSARRFAHDGSATGRNRRRSAPRLRCGEHCRAADRAWQRRSEPAHAGTGLQPGRNRLVDGGNDLHREAERGERQPRQPAGSRSARTGRAWWRSGCAGGYRHARDQRRPAARFPTSSA